MEVASCLLSLNTHNILLLLFLTLLIFFIRPILHLARNHFTLLPDSSICSAQLTVSQYTSKIGQVECVFCLCDIEEGEEIRELNCKHLFHRSCLDKWAKFGRATCPLCRDSLLPLEVKMKLSEVDDEDIDELLSLDLVAAYVLNEWWLWWIISWAPCLRACS